MKIFFLLLTISLIACSRVRSNSRQRPLTPSTTPNPPPLNNTVLEEYRRQMTIALETDKEVRMFNDDDCSVLRGPPGIFKILKYQDTLIGGSNDNLKLLYMKSYNVNKTDDGTIVQIDIDNNKITDIPIEGYPKHLSFHPLGMTLYKDSLYVINHAYTYGATRVEVIRISKQGDKIKLKYIKSIIMVKELIGVANDLVVVGDNDQMYITTYRPYPDDQYKGRNNTNADRIEMLGNIIGDYKESFTFFCDGHNEKFSGRCYRVKESPAIASTGIAYDPIGILYIANFYEKKIRTFEVNLRDKTQLTPMDDINLDYAPYNIDLDMNTGYIWVAIQGKIQEYLKLITDVINLDDIPTDVKMSGGALLIDTKNDNKINMLVMQDSFYGVTSVATKDSNLVLGSFWDNGVNVCKMPSLN